MTILAKRGNSPRPTRTHLDRREGTMGLVRAAVGVSTALLLLGCMSASNDWPHLVPLGGKPNQVVAVNPNIRPGQEHFYGSMILCLNRPGSVTVTSVTAVKPSGGIKVVGYGLRPSPFWKGGGDIGDANGGLARNHFPATKDVTVTCDSRTGRAYELAVVVAKTSTSPGITHGLDIAYTSASHRGSLTYPLTIVLCTGKVKRDPLARNPCKPT